MRARCVRAERRARRRGCSGSGAIGVRGDAKSGTVTYDSAAAPRGRDGRAAGSGKTALLPSPRAATTLCTTAVRAAVPTQKRGRMAHPPEHDGSTATEAPARADPAAHEPMAAAARTASALAHQFANYLGTMHAMVQLLAERVKTDREAAQDVEVLEQSVAGAGRFLEALRGFTHPEPLGAGSCDLNGLLREAEPALRGVARAGVEVAVRPGAGRLEVRGDAARVRRLALALVTALAGDGAAGARVVIETGTAGATAAAGGALLLARTSRPEFDAGKAARIFEPFAFDPSYDGGLRLPTVYAVVARSGGSVTVETSPGGGTTFRVVLPGPVGAGKARAAS